MSKPRYVRTIEFQLKYVCRKYEDKLIELMGLDKFKDFSTDIAKEMFFNSIRDIKDPEFRNFCLDNFDAITSTVDASNIDFPNSEKGGNTD